MSAADFVPPANLIGLSVPGCSTSANNTRTCRCPFLLGNRLTSSPCYSTLQHNSSAKNSIYVVQQGNEPPLVLISVDVKVIRSTTANR